ncbi:MAG: 3-deoxy-manno-octulosonate cytidylyltransferase [Gammaproteobacteria bacterium]
MSARFNIVIPARYGSSRLPGKPLRLLAGRPMIEHVHRRAVESGAREVIVATDDVRIEAAVRDFGGTVCMTAADHPSGTDRLAEVVRQLQWADDTVVVNLQGDEPLMPPALIEQVAGDLAGQGQAGMATVCAPITTTAELFDPHVVKVVADGAGFALYFSRAPIPWDRDAFAVTNEELPAGLEHFRHIGLYAYRAAFLKHYSELQPCPMERAEALEQLRALWHGVRIHVVRAVAHPGAGVDTEQDIARVEQLLSAGQGNTAI